MKITKMNNPKKITDKSGQAGINAGGFKTFMVNI